MIFLIVTARLSGASCSLCVMRQDQFFRITMRTVKYFLPDGKAVYILFLTSSGVGISALSFSFHAGPHSGLFFPVCQYLLFFGYLIKIPLVSVEVDSLDPSLAAWYPRTR